MGDTNAGVLGGNRAAVCAGVTVQVCEIQSGGRPGGGKSHRIPPGIPKGRGEGAWKRERDGFTVLRENQISGRLMESVF